MATGYTRQSSSQITAGQPITSAPVNNEFNQLVSTFSISGGHNHDGTTTGCGPQLGTIALTPLTSTSAGVVSATGSNSFAVRTLTGTSNRLTITNGTGASANPTFDISSSYVGQSTITTLGTIATGVWNGTIITGTYGGTGINNGASTITLSGNLATSGSNALTLTTTGTTNVTLPTSGTIVNSAVTTLSSLVSVGTITTGVWNAQGITTSSDLTVNSDNININGRSTGQPTQLKLLQFDQSASHAMYIAQNTSGSFSVFNQTTGTEVIEVAQATDAISLRGNTSIAGTLAVLNGVNLLSTLQVAGTSTLAATTTGALSATTGVFSSTLTVTGSTTLNSGLTVSGSTTLNGGGTSTTASPGDNSTKIATTAFVAAATSSLASAYPIGSLYFNAGVSTNPATLLGFGTWAAFGEGQIIIGVGSYTDGNGTLKTITNGQQLGEYNHTLITAEMPSHTHTDSGHVHVMTNVVFDPGGPGTTNNIGGTNDIGTGGSHSTASGSASLSNTGSGTSHNNIQPSIGVYIWQRTA